MLTERQNAVVNFLKETHARTGLIPTTREIQEHLGYKSQTSVQDILEALERKGVLERKPGRAQPWTMSAFTNRPKTIEVPFYGSIAAGLPVHQEQENDSCIIIDIETFKIPNNARTFALKVRGDSMIDVGIFPGDTVILQIKEAQPKDIVAALIDGETTLKRYIVKNGKPYLKAENKNYRDLVPAQELVIQGIVIAVLRLIK